MVKLPWFSSMHLRKLLTSVAHAPDDCCICAVAWCCWAKSVFWGAASAGADEPPLNQPPTAWPMEEPTATPLRGR
jgi:streptolysin S family bacteriocin protoxin